MQSPSLECHRGVQCGAGPYLYVHNGGFLELFRDFNGGVTGTSAHQCLSGKPVEDWLRCWVIRPPPR